MAVKNQAITIQFSVVDVSTGLGKTGDAANLTIKLIQDGVAAAPTNLPVEVDATNAPGTYKIALTAAEMNYDTVRIAGKSSTANTQVIPRDIPIEPTQFTTNGSNKYVCVDIQAIAGSNSGDSYFLHNMVQDYGLHNSKIPAVVSDVVTAKIGNGHIPITASIRSDDRYMVAAQFTKAGAAVEPSVAPTCAADCIVVSDDYPTGHTFSFGSLTPQYNSTTKSYYVLGVLASAVIGNRAGLLICKFHTDDATVDAPDVTCAVAVNMDIYAPAKVEDVLAAVEAKTRMLGVMTMTLQTPVVSIKEFEIIRGDSYTNETPFPNRPLQLTCEAVPYDFAALMEEPHAVRVHLKTATSEIVVKPYAVVSNGLNSFAYTILFGFTDEVSRAMTAGTYEWEIKAYYLRAAGPPANYDVITQGRGTYTVKEPVYDGGLGPKTPSA